ncbi:MAG TPA: hypothetical protein VF306_07240, partial [Pirellulales bacterium]
DFFALLMPKKSRRTKSEAATRNREYPSFFILPAILKRLGIPNQMQVRMWIVGRASPTVSFHGGQCPPYVLKNC